MRPISISNALSRAVVGLVAMSAMGSAFAQRTVYRMDSNWKLKVSPPEQFTPSNQLWRYIPEFTQPLALGANLDPDQIQKLNQSNDFAKPLEDVFHSKNGFLWFQRRLTGVPSKKKGAVQVIHFSPVDDNATVYINGYYSFHHEGWNDPFDVPLGSHWHKNGANEITVLVENTAGPGSIGAISLETRAAMGTPTESKVGYDDSKWRTVQVPHDFVIEGQFAENADAGHGGLPRGMAWYRRNFVLPKSSEGKEVWIDFEGTFSDARVWVNGHFVAAHRSGYTGYQIDLSKVVHPGSNAIAVHLDSSKTEGWWYEGGGIYRHVFLTVTDPVHIKPLTLYTYSTVSGLGTDEQSAVMHVSGTVQNSLKSSKWTTAQIDVIDPFGAVVATSNVSNLCPANSERKFEADLTVNHPHLWSIDVPNLYRVRVTLTNTGGPEPAGKVTPIVYDSETATTGIRTLKFDPQLGFFLNGKSVKLQGTCNHQDFAGTGIGMPDSVLYWRIKKLKEMGSNAYRCSHNEVAPELLDACDRLGMVVMDENREFGDTFTGKANQQTTTNDLSDLEQEVRRDRNHPSVIMWSLCNEEWAVQGNAAGIRIGTALKNRVLSLDKTRPITAAMNGAHFTDGLGTVLDLEGFNYTPEDYEKYHQLHPDHPMFGSETASTTTTRGEYARNNEKGYVPAYDNDGTQTAEAAWEPIAREPYNAGGFVWTGFDYKGEPTPFGWPDINSHFGIMDTCGFPKDLYYYYQAWWGNKPSVHVFPQWNWPGKEGQPIDVWVFGNGDEVELYLNGVSLGKKAMPKYEHLEWKVPYQPGELRAISLTNGKIVATDEVRTSGPADHLVAHVLRAPLTANQEDCAMIEVTVVDANGVPVPTASNLVTFTASGAGQVVGVGNGDPSCHEPDRSNKRSAFNGKVLGIFQTGNSAGRATVVISSPGLKSVTVSFNVQSSKDHEISAH